MTLEIGLLLGIVAIAAAAFASERMPPDVVGLGLLRSLVLSGLLHRRRRSRDLAARR